jgi:hypothetical protein
MSWAMYEPMDSVHTKEVLQMPGIHEKPSMQHKSDYVTQTPVQQQMPQQMPHQLPSQKVATNNSKNVNIPEGTPAKTTWQDISDYHDLNDWGFLVVAAIVIEVVVIAITRFFPVFSGKYLNLWYSRFKLSAVLLDILSVLIGFGIARYIYTEYIYPKNDWNPWYFTGTALVVQILHDILFYIGVIRQVPESHNGLIDVFKKYAEAAGAKVILGDSAIMVGTSITSMLLKAAPFHAVIFLGLAGLYTLPYFMEAKNEFSVLS